MKKCIFAFIVLLVSSPALADHRQNNAVSPFDDRYSYDIHFNSSEYSASVVNNVEILRFEEIAGKMFLVIRSKGFNLKDEEGFILFDSISAILPDNNLKVERSKRIR